MDIDLSNLELNRQHFMVLTPVLQSLDGDYEQQLAPVGDYRQGTPQGNFPELAATR
ncbi:MAG: hypothetical protein ACOX19_12875 [Fermentimonas sp.]